MDVKRQIFVTMAVSKIDFLLLANLLMFFFCIWIEFCPAYCDFEKEQHCSGEKDPKTGDLTTPDTCIPMYDENGCWNQCQTTCPANADGQWCTKQDSNGCELGWCDSGSTVLFVIVVDRLIDFPCNIFCIY